ncbi:MAG: helix-turn-helix domain-containing protein [Hydrococcus sp. Prado102]|jgi:DNA-binding Xre family transcriptional regulator|nr:helix-turn-helix domain-containing protein [Hydrococcus sp. Prado102]
MSNNPHIGSSLDDFLELERVGAEVNAVALKRVLAWQIEQAMVEKGLSKTEMAKAMKTSRAALNRLLDPLNTSVTLNTIERAARAIGKQLQLELVDAVRES